MLKHVTSITSSIRYLTKQIILSVSIFSSKESIKFFRNESGSHRWQRVPPTESKGRVHTSSITVAVMDEETYSFKLNSGDVRRIYTRGTGPGGQHKNKVETCVILTHKPTGISAKVDGRVRTRNEEQAWKELNKRVGEYYQGIEDIKTSNKRKTQIGNGNRSEKRRTYNVKTNTVIDHITGKRTNLKSILRGKLELLH